MKISDVNKFKGGKNNFIKSVRSKNWQIEVGGNIIFEGVGRDTNFGPIYTVGAIYTGWGAQSWTTFCGPAAVAIGGCERKY